MLSRTSPASRGPRASRSRRWSVPTRSSRRCADVVPFDHAEIAAIDPFDGSRRLLANAGYSDDMLEHFHGPEFDEEIRSLDMHETGYPVRMRDVPGDELAVRTIAEKLRARRLHRGHDDVPAHGVRARDRPPQPVDVRRPASVRRRSATSCRRSARRSPTWPTRRSRRGSWCRCSSPARSRSPCPARAPSRPLAGIATHPLLSAGAQLPRLAHAIIGRDGRGSTRFLWPAGDRRWHRVGVTPCQSDGPAGCEAHRHRPAPRRSPSSSPAASSRC